MIDKIDKQKFIRDEIHKLVPGVIQIGAEMYALERDPTKSFCLKWAFELLAKELQRVEKAEAEIDQIDIPDRIDEKYAESYKTAVHRARLAVYVASIAIARIHATEAGFDTNVLRDLLLPLESAFTGSGQEHLKLRAKDPVPNTPEAAEQAVRARIFALVELVADDQKLVTKVYDATEKLGFDRQQVRRMVNNARSPNGLQDSTFHNLVAFEKKYLQPRVDAGDSIDRLLRVDES